MSVYSEIKPDIKPLGLTEEALERGKAVATGLRSIAIADIWLAAKGVVRRDAVWFDVDDKNLILIPSKPLPTKVYGFTDASPDGLYGKYSTETSDKGEIRVPRRLAKLAISSSSDLNKVLLYGTTTRTMVEDASSPYVAQFETVAFVLDEHTLAVE